MKRISWNGRTKNREVLHTVKEDMDILYIINRRICKWIIPKHVIDGKIKGTGRRRKQLQDDFKEKRGYCKLKEGALDRLLWRTRFEGSYGPVLRRKTF
jgi:hypothetical protein